MANLAGNRILFFTTSPRTPMKMIPEIELLGKHFTGKDWNLTTQEEFMKTLAVENFFKGSGCTRDLAFSARDRISRAPKALGFVDLKPTIKLTEAGEALVNTKRKEEVFLRQLLKFQLPSPYHKNSNNNASIFRVKPYLEIFRLICHFGSLTFDEVIFFGLQLTDYRKFDDVVKLIDDFRIKKAEYKGNYKKFRAITLEETITSIYSKEIERGETQTRESNDASIKKFIGTKASNMRDYTDACFRYLRSTGMVNISHIGRSISISKEKKNDVFFFLNSIDREPIYVEDELSYKDYLFNSATPVLYTDNRENLIEQIQFISSEDKTTLKSFATIELKDKLADYIDERKNSILTTKIKVIKDYKEFDDIINTYESIKKNELYDAPLMLEWNTWRAMTMIDGGNIKANLIFDDMGEPMSTAQGNMADIICDYGDYGLTIEVTMQSGQRQYEMEGEPVARHLAKLKRDTGKDAFCLFIALTINDSSKAFFYTLHKTNLNFYGGTSVIVPMELGTFIKMVSDSYKVSYVPNPSHIKDLFDYSRALAKIAENEDEWYQGITEKALNWLSA